MKTLRRLFRRLTSWVTSARDEELLRAEFEEHIAMQTAENLRAGLSPIEARRQALLKFGSVEAIKEIYRDAARTPVSGNAVARYAPCTTRPAKGARLHGSRHPDAGAGYRREYRYLCRDRQHPDPAAAVSAGRGAGRRLAHGARVARCPRQTRLFSFHVFHLPRGEPDLRTVRSVELRRRKRHRGCRAGTASSALRDLRRAGCRGREASSGPLVFAGGRHTGVGGDGHAHLRLLAAPLRGRQVHRRADADDRFEAAHGDRRDAGGIPFSARSRADSSPAVRTEQNVSGRLRLPGHRAAQTRRHHGAGQRRCGSHVGESG